MDQNPLQILSQSYSDILTSFEWVQIVNPAFTKVLIPYWVKHINEEKERTIEQETMAPGSQSQDLDSHSPPPAQCIPSREDVYIVEVDKSFHKIFQILLGGFRYSKEFLDPSFQLGGFVLE